MADNLTLEKSRTAILVMDFENEIVNRLPAPRREAVLNTASRVILRARQTGIPVIYVVVRFRNGYPEVSPRNKAFRTLKGEGRLQENSPSTQIHSQVAPLESEVVVTKRRVGAFYATDLEAALRARDISTLVLLGIATSGVVLSTVRTAADMDYELIVLSDGCTDFDEETHRLLMDRVFPRQATVVTSQELIEALGS